MQSSTQLYKIKTALLTLIFLNNSLKLVLAISFLQNIKHINIIYKKLIIKAIINNLKIYFILLNNSLYTKILNIILRILYFNRISNKG